MADATHVAVAVVAAQDVLHDPIETDELGFLLLDDGLRWTRIDNEDGVVLRRMASQPDHAQAARLRRQSKRSVMRGHDQTRIPPLSHEQGGREVDGVQGAVRCRKGLSSAGQHGSRGLDQLDLLQQSEDRFAPDRQLLVGDSSAQTESVERPEAFHLAEGTREAATNGSPFRELSRLSKHHPEHDR
jgi:hypothetical protein